MAERIIIKIIPPSGESGELSVQDAMRQVLDAFHLLTAEDKSVVWRLITASTNSPLTVVAEADESPLAAEQKRSFAASLAELQAGRFPQAWKRPELAATASALLLRSSEFIARTEFTLDETSAPLVISPEMVAPFRGLPILPINESEPLSIPPHTKRQIGSIQGLLIEVTTYRSRPAIRLRERKTGREITCVLSPDLAGQFSHDSSAQDVWDNRRFTVRGWIFYQSSGQILRLEATEVGPDQPIERPLRDIRDPEFTGGLSAAEYLERFRSGELG